MEKQPLKVKKIPLVFEQSASQTNSLLGCSIQQQGPILVFVCVSVSATDLQQQGRKVAAEGEMGGESLAQ